MHDFENSAVLSLVPKVQITADRARARYEPRIEVELADGRTIDWEEGEPGLAYDLDWARAVTMTHAFAEEAKVDTATIERLITAVSSLESATSPEPLITAICDATAAAVAA